MTPPCSSSARSAASRKPAKANEEAFERAVDAITAATMRAARRPRDERAAQGPRGRGGEGARPVGAALRRVARSRVGLRVSGRGPARLLCLSWRVHRRAWVGCLAAIAAMLLAGASPASAAGGHGPLDVPRRLRVAPGDAPRPRVRHARGPRADRARQRPGAQTRRSATSGTFGPDLCVAGFVWREALPGRPRLRHARPPGSRCTTTT